MLPCRRRPPPPHPPPTLTPPPAPCSPDRPDRDPQVCFRPDCLRRRRQRAARAGDLAARPHHRLSAGALCAAREVRAGGTAALWGGPLNPAACASQAHQGHCPWPGAPPGQRPPLPAVTPADDNATVSLAWARRGRPGMPAGCTCRLLPPRPAPPLRLTIPFLDIASPDFERPRGLLQARSANLTTGTSSQACRAGPPARCPQRPSGEPRREALSISANRAPLLRCRLRWWRQSMCRGWTC